MVMVGMSLKLPNGRPVVDERMLNGVVIMILFTCIISSMVTEWAAQKITLRDKDFAPEVSPEDDEKILIPVKYPEYANRLVNMGIMMRNPKLNRSLVALNVVYDDEYMRQHQEQGRRLLEQVTQYASGSDVKMQTQVRVAANIANGIKHAFKEFRASEILAGNLECRILFHGRTDTLQMIREYIQNRHADLRATYVSMDHWNEMPKLAASIADDHLFVVVTARKGTVSYKAAQDRLPEELTKYFSGKNLMIIFPDQYGDDMSAMTFAQPQHTEEQSAYELLRNWLHQKRNL